MRITAAVPCYNAEKFVADCIESLLAQSRPPDEIIVVDDGSTDKSAEIVFRYSVGRASHCGLRIADCGLGDESARTSEPASVGQAFQPVTKIKLITLDQNKGVAHARNVLLNEATGDVIVFIDSDATADADLIKELERCYESDVAGVGGRALEARRETLADRWRGVHASQGHGEAFRERVDFLWGVCSSYRRSVLLEAGGFDERFRTNGEDMEMGLRLNSMGKVLHYTPTAFVHHQRSDSITSLCKMLFRWHFWGYVAMRKVRGKAFAFYVKTCVKVLLRNLYIDLVREKSLSLALVSLLAFPVELWATVKAAFEARRFLRQPN